MWLLLAEPLIDAGPHPDIGPEALAIVPRRDV
jgi:hypothetical protein